MALQVIGAGLGRTGTLSLKFALEYLGFDPCYHMAERELAAAYPEAKIILSLRDPESWFRSVNETIFSPQMLDMIGDSPAKAFFAGSVLADFGDRIADHDFMVAYFERWNQAVIDAVPPERLLLFEARQGWAPLCAFLGVPVPAIAYPRVNSRDEMVGHVDTAQAPSAGPPSFEAIGGLLKQRLATQREAAFAGVTA